MEMKIIFLISMSICIVLCCNSTADNNKSVNAILKNERSVNDSIACSDISISTTTIGIEKNEFIKIIGQPDSISKMVDTESTPDFIYDRLSYSENEFYFDKGLLFGCLLNNSKFELKGISVGNTITKIANKYPLSYNNSGMNAGYSQIEIDCYEACIKNGKKILGPDKISISYDENKIITRIICVSF